MAHDPILDSLVIGAGQAGLSASFHLTRLDIEHVVLDSNAVAGGAWQHRWDALTMQDVHGVAELPGSAPPPLGPRRANTAVPEYFAAYEREHSLPIIRPVGVDRVESVDGLLHVYAGDRMWRARTLVNATVLGRSRSCPTIPVLNCFAVSSFIR